MKRDIDGVTMTPQYVRKYKLGIGAQGFLFNGKEFYKALIPQHYNIKHILIS